MQGNDTGSGLFYYPSFKFENNNDGEGDRFITRDGKYATVSWTGNVNGLVIKKIVINCRHSADSGNATTTLAIYNTSGTAIESKQFTINSNYTDYTFEPTDVSTVAGSIRVSFSRSLEYLRVHSITITYEGTLPSFYAKSIASSDGNGVVKTSFSSLSADDAFNNASTVDTKTVDGDKLGSGSKGSVIAYYRAVPNSSEYNFVGWYTVENNTPTETLYSDQPECTKSFTTTLTNSLSPETNELYAKFTQLQVPTFTFDLRVGILGEGGASTTYSNVFTTDNDETDLSSVTSSNTSVASVSYSPTNRTIDVTVKAKGTANITVSQAGLDGVWMEKTVVYTIVVVKKGEWIWQQDEVLTNNSYYVYAAGNGFLNISDGFDEESLVSSGSWVLWTIGENWKSAYTLTSGSNKFSIYRQSSTNYAKTSLIDKKGDDIILSSTYDKATGYYTIYRAKTMTGQRNVKVENGNLLIDSNPSKVWVFVSPAQKAAFVSYATASTYVGKYSTSCPSLEKELSEVISANNYSSNDWVTCKANLDAIIAKCADYDKFDEDSHTRTVNTTGDGFASFYSAFAVQLPSGVKAYKGVYDNGTLTLTDINQEGYVPACTPVILYRENTTSATTITLTYNDGTGLSEVEDNMLHGSIQATALNGTSITIDEVTGTPYVLGYQNFSGEGAEAGFFRYEGSSVGANKAFLVVSGSSSLAAIRISTFEEGATDLPIESAVLDKSQPMFNVLGQRVDASYRGIVIQRGVKFFNY